MKKIVWVYWESMRGSKEPSYITLSRMTMLKNLQNCTVVFVTPDNVEQYLPGVSELLSGIEVDVQGRVDLFTRKFKPMNRKNIAVKCDAIRAFLLYQYGGIYIDADAIVLQDFDKYFAMLEQKEFFISQRQSHGKNHMSVGFYGSVAKGAIISAYVAAIKARLQQGKTLAYNELGAAMITPIISCNLATAHIYPEQETQPITFEESAIFLDENQSIDAVLPTDQTIFMLFNDPFNREIKQMPLQQFYQSKMLISRLFRKAIGSTNLDRDYLS